MTWILFLVFFGSGNTTELEKIGPFGSQTECLSALEEIKEGEIGATWYGNTATRFKGQCIMIERHATNEEFD